MVSVQRDPPFGLFSEGLSARLRALGPRGQSSLATITASPRSRSRGPPHPDRKAWVRYVPPRWIYAGAAICGGPERGPESDAPRVVRTQRRIARQSVLWLHEADD